MVDINEIITDPYILNEGFIYRDGFVFTFGQEFPSVLNRIVIRKPQRARADESRMGYSYRSLEEHIEVINKYQIKKARIICDDLDFILKCPSLNDLEVCPSYEAKDDFDYSVLYKMPSLKKLSCVTSGYGDDEQRNTVIDYSKIDGLEEINMSGKGNIGYENVETLREMWVAENKKMRELSNISCSSVLEKLTFIGCGLQSLNGIENYKRLRSLTLLHNYSLKDISAMSGVADSLVELAIDACSKIKDFTALNSLKNLEYLQLDGNNKLPSLSFLENMNNLKCFVFYMNVEDGDLSNCLNVPYVHCKNRKHYNLKDEDLPKRNLVKKEEWLE